MKTLLTNLNESEGRNSGTGKADVHYIFIWSTDALQCFEYDVISCGIEEQPLRRAQYFQFLAVSNGEPLHVYYNHSPASDNLKLTDGRRKRICVTLWNHLRSKSSAVRPAVVFGGDFNISPLQWSLCFQELMETQSSRRTVQMCKSRFMGGHKGDNAIAINVRATFETSGFGISWQDKVDSSGDTST